MRAPVVAAAAAVLAVVLLGAAVLTGAVLPLADRATPAAGPSPGDPAGAGTTAVRCRGDTGDAALIQGVVDASRAGDEVVLAGPCLLTRTVVLRGDRSYRGAGAGTRLTAAPGSDLPAVLASDAWADDRASTGLPVTVRDLTIDGNRERNQRGGDGIVLRSWRTTVEDVTVTGAPADGVRVTSLSRNGTGLTGTQVNGTLRNLFVTGSGRNGVHVEDPANAVTDWVLTDSWIADSGASGVRMDNAAGWTVRGNHVYGNGEAGLRLNRLFATTVTGNYVEDFGTEGLGATVQGDAASVVSGNRLFQFRGAGRTFLHLGGVTYGTGTVVVTGNAIRGRGTGTGMLFDGGARPLTVVSSGNAVTGVAEPRRAAAGVEISAGG